MADTTLQTPYATAMPYVATKASAGWVDEYDNQRLMSYDLYDDLFNNTPAQFKLMLRGTDEKPIYVPTAKGIINALARYVGKNWGIQVKSNAEDAELDPTAEVATDEQVAAAQNAFGKLIARERLLSVFRSGVPEWLRRADWCWYVTADPLKAEGRRISVRVVDPRRYFPLNNDTSDLSRVTGQELREETMVGDTAAVLVQTYLKYTDPGHPDYGSEEPPEGFPITYQVQAYDQKDFLDPTKRKALAHPENLPQTILEGITALPIYHIRNNETTDDPFGRSDLSGLESVIAGINQSWSDEDLSLAFMGIGMYWTDSGAPVDETTGQATSWKLGPKRVIEVDEGTSFNKVDGITSVEPFQTHISGLKETAQATMGLSDVSVGTAENVTAESGIALAIRFSPTQDTAVNKNAIINGVLTQMFHDLKQWFAVYEGIDMGEVVVTSVTDNANLLPFDREGRWQELMEGVTAGVFTPEYAVSVLEEEFGYVFPAGYVDDLTAANAAKAAAADPFASRTGAEAGSATDEELAASADATQE